MFRYNAILFLCVFFVGLFSHAQQPKTVHRKPAQAFQGFSHFNLELSYISWKEFVSLGSPTGSDKTYGDYVGNAVTFEYEQYWLPHWGAIAEVSAIFGQASLGGRQTGIAYQQSDVTWWGVKGSYRGAYRISSQITASVGPMILNRQIDLPTTASATSVQSGATANFGLTGDIRLILSPHFIIRSELGGLFQDASTLWSLGVGYRF